MIDHSDPLSPGGAAEKDTRAALADLAFARDSHLAWAEHLEAHSISGDLCAECEGKPYKLNAAHEREWVAKYDRIIAIVKGAAEGRSRAVPSDDLPEFSAEELAAERAAFVEWLNKRDVSPSVYKLLTPFLRIEGLSVMEIDPRDRERAEDLVGRFLSSSEPRDISESRWEQLARLIAEALSLVRQEAQQEIEPEPPLWRHAVNECNEAHLLLDRYSVPASRSVRRVRGPDGSQDVTVGLSERIRSLGQRVDAMAYTVKQKNALLECATSQSRIRRSPRPDLESGT